MVWYFTKMLFNIPEINYNNEPENKTELCSLYKIHYIDIPTSASMLICFVLHGWVLFFSYIEKPTKVYATLLHVFFLHLTLQRTLLCVMVYISLLFLDTKKWLYSMLDSMWYSLKFCLCFYERKEKRSKYFTMKIARIFSGS